MSKKKCECGKHQPTFKLYDGPARWCSLCPNKPINAVSNKKKCNCGVRPSFNLPGKITPIWCTKCKSPEAVNVIDKRCKCGKHKPTFGFVRNDALWCSECPDKPSEAINVLSKLCPCGIQASFNLPEKKTGKWCAKCPEKPEEAVDVVNKKCECGKHKPNFNLPGEITPIWCASCKPLEAVNVTSKLCICGKQPCFNLPGELTGKWCLECKPEKAINVKDKLCKECNLVQVKNKYEGYCVRCFVNIFPDKPVSRNYKVRENYIFDSVIELLPKDITLIRDKVVGGCSRRRPNLMIDMGSSLDLCRK